MTSYKATTTQSREYNKYNRSCGTVFDRQENCSSGDWAYAVRSCSFGKDQPACSRLDPDMCPTMGGQTPNAMQFNPDGEYARFRSSPRKTAEVECFYNPSAFTTAESLGEFKKHFCGGDCNSAAAGENNKTLWNNYLLPSFCGLWQDGKVNLETQPECLVWCANNKAQCDAVPQLDCSGAKLETQQCRDYCAREDTNCDLRLTEYCTSLGVEEAMGKEICGCFMGSDFYANFFSSLEDRVQGVPSGLPSYPECYFPNCAISPVQNYSAKRKYHTCPDLVQCIQTVHVDATGAIVEDSPFIIKPTANCSSQYSTKVEEGETCVTNDDCRSARCGSKGSCLAAPATPAEGEGDTCAGTGRSTCSKGQECVEGACQVTDPDDDEGAWSWSWGAIGLIILAVVFLLLLYFLVVHKRSPVPGESTEVTTPSTPEPTE